jgi:hypothetical protein
MLVGNQPFAVLLCNFQDSANPRPFSKTEVERAFITRNTRSINDYFIDNSNGKISLDGSAVFGWTTLPMSKATFIAKFMNISNQRLKIANEAKRYFSINYSMFVGVIIIFSDAVGDAWTVLNNSIFDPSIAKSSYICHELGHVLGEAFGVSHSFDFSKRTSVSWIAPGEYQDQTDIMSARNVWAYSDMHNCFDLYGPNFCVIHKKLWGWLDKRKIKTYDFNFDFHRVRNHGYYSESFTLYSRSHPEISGLQFISLSFSGQGSLYIEFVTPESWDAGLATGVIIHQDVVNKPYIIVNDILKPDEKFWTEGMKFKREYTYKNNTAHARTLSNVVYVHIVKIDKENHSVKIDITNKPKYYAPEHVSLQIIAIRKYHSTAGGGFYYIGEVGVRDNTGTLRSIERYDVVEWIRSGRNTFFVNDGLGNFADVIIKDGHMITTTPDDNQHNNLLSLPEF